MTAGDETPAAQTFLTRSFFARPTLQVARELLGVRLVRVEGERRIEGVIVETEAYIHETDLASHARAGRTARTEAMYGPPGHAYVYFTYGMHWCVNFVTEAAGMPAAVLIRAIEPVDGLDLIAARRPGRPRREWCNGPGKLCQALAIDRRFNGADLCTPQAALYVRPGKLIPDSCVTIGPRVGLTNVPEPWKSMPWRFQGKIDC
ncbi:MAG: DNA-3-methyladenine glycosylase [Chloroflexota bacterium]